MTIALNGGTHPDGFNSLHKLLLNKRFEASVNDGLVQFGFGFEVFCPDACASNEIR